MWLLYERIKLSKFLWRHTEGFADLDNLNLLMVVWFRAIATTPASSKYDA